MINLFILIFAIFITTNTIICVLLLLMWCHMKKTIPVIEKVSKILKGGRNE